MKKGLLPRALVALICLSLFLAGVNLCSSGWAALAEDQDVVLARERAAGPDPAYYVPQEAIVGTGYRLASLTWQVSGSASSDDYLLLGPTTATLRGSGCCCTYLPIAVRRAK
jgi:hypothetical protein